MEPYENKPEQGKRTLWIVAGIVLVIALVGVIYGATQRTIKKTNPDGTTNTPLRNQPAGSATTGGTVAGENRQSVNATVEGMDIVNLQTFPYRVQARVRGSVPDSCSSFNTPSVTQSGKTFTVSVTASRPVDAMCAQVVTSQETVVDLPVAGLAAGTYTVKLGKISKTFTLTTNNSVEYSGDK